MVLSGGEVFWAAGSTGDSDAHFVYRCPLTGCPPDDKAQAEFDTNNHGQVDLVTVATDERFVYRLTKTTLFARRK